MLISLLPNVRNRRYITTVNVTLLEIPGSFFKLRRCKVLTDPPQLSPFFRLKPKYGVVLCTPELKFKIGWG